MAAMSASTTATQQAAPVVSSLNALFRLKAHQRQKAVDFILSTIHRLLQNPTQLKLPNINAKIGDCQPALQLLYDLGFEQYTSADNKTGVQIKCELNGANDDRLVHLQSIYDKMYYKNSARALVHRQEFNCKALMAEFPPKYKDGRKKAVFKLIVPNGADDCPGSLIYARHQVLELPALIPDPTDFIQHRMKIEANIYEYVSNTQDLSKLHFYVNFADANLFGFYTGSLFAQDEIMTFEHPILAALRERLLASDGKDDDKLVAYCRGSVIVSNALKHGHFSQEKLAKIYGGKFAGSTVSKIKQSVQICNPPIVDNIICIASLMGMGKKYKQSELETLLKTAYCGFNGAVCESLYQRLKLNKEVDSKQKENEQAEEEKKSENADLEAVQNKSPIKKQIVVHTGNWGCGAFGGNVTVHSMLQVIAAVAADVDFMHYHAVDQKSVKKAKAGCDVLLKQLYPKCKDKRGRMKTKTFVSELLKMGYKWGTPNGT